jgi:subfamily B ATP-binding cassette protein MsbA
MHRINIIFKFSWPFLRPYRVWLAMGLLFGILFGLSNGGVLWLTQTLIERLENTPSDSAFALSGAGQEADSYFGQIKFRIKNTVDAWIDPWFPKHDRKLDLKQLVGIFLFLPLFTAFRSFSSYLSSYFLAYTSEHVVNDLRVKVLETLSCLSLDYFNRSTMGDMITRINGDTGNLQRCLRNGVEHIIKEPVTILSVFFIMLFIDPMLTMGAMILVPIFVLPVLALGKKAKRAAKKMVRTNVTQSSLMVEMLSSIRVIKAFNLEQTMVGRFRDLSRYLIRQTLKTVRAKELVNPIIETGAILGLGALIVFVVQTQRPINHLVTFFMGIIMFYTPVKKLGKWHIQVEQASVGIGRLMDILAETPTVKEPDHPKSLSGFQESIEFKDVSFSYLDEIVLKNIQLSVPRGYRLGIAGESGSGKSTLVNLFFRFYDPTQGQISIDGIDLREMSLADVKNLIALVSQDIVVFDQTAAENIGCGKPGATRGEIEAAARHAHADEFIQRLPEGYDTRLGEQGVTLSGGQRQRIAIARAFIKDAPILILDEATASLDSQSEGEVQAAIEELSENRTVICVAHRLATLKSSDCVIVLSKGKIIEQGGFEELIRRDGIFAAMAVSQGIKPTSNIASV